MEHKVDKKIGKILSSKYKGKDEWKINVVFGFIENKNFNEYLKILP